jgi:hypothetical protein
LAARHAQRPVALAAPGALGPGTRRLAGPRRSVGIPRTLGTAHYRRTRSSSAGRASHTDDVPDHPAYQQILTTFADTGKPLRARDLCQALDLPIVPKNTEGIRSKLKRLVTRGILTEPEPGLFAQPCP